MVLWILQAEHLDLQALRDRKATKETQAIALTQVR
jgi:hypothetical protein